MSALSMIAAVVMGFVLGILGGGGSILATPILLYLVDLPDKEAIATSLLVVGATSVFATIPHARAGHVKLKVGIIFGGIAMIGAYIGGRIAAYISGHVLLVLFAMLMLAASAGMLFRERGDQSQDETHPNAEISIGMLVLMGSVVGLLTGLVGVGGGFVIVPALVVLGRLPMRLAIGTSLAIIAMNSFSGLAGYMSHVEIDLKLAGLFSLFSLVGAWLGTAVSHRIETHHLRAGFGYFVLNVGAFVFGAQLAWPTYARLVLAISLTVLAIIGRRIKATRRHRQSVNTASSGSNGHA